MKKSIRSLFGKRTLAAVTAAVTALSMGASSAAAIDLTYTIDSNGLSVKLLGTNKSEETELSVDGGENYFQIDSSGVRIKKINPGDYQLCARRKGDRKYVPYVTTAHVSADESKSKIKLSVMTSPEVNFSQGAITVTVENYDKKGNYYVSTDGGRTWNPMTAASIKLKGLRSGYYNVICANRQKGGGSSDMIKTYVGRRPKQNSAYVTVDPVMQLPELPTGCEVTALTMVINSMGFPISKEVLADYYLEKGAVNTVSYRRKFVGDPRTKYSYGCYAPVIEKCAHSFLDNVKGRDFRIVNMSGSSLDDVLRCVDMGCPVIVWATIDMRAPFITRRWKDAETGETVAWLAEEHCLLLTGYDRGRNTVTVNDPLKGRVSYDMKLFQTRYDQLAKQAIVISEIK